MNIDDIRTVCVVGAGNMGHQISLHLALYGYRTLCTDISEAALEKAGVFARSYLKGRVEKGKLTEDKAAEALGNLRFTSDLQEAVGSADYVIEAAVEKINVKRELFAELDRFAPEHAILATNSSFIVSSRIADFTNRPDKVVNLHFFNPALVMKLVEVVQGPHVSDETCALSIELCRKIDKVPVHIRKEVDGFLLNRILWAIKREAQWLYDMGVASFEDIDKACVYGLGHPMGPFRLEDLTGIDLNYILAMEKFKKTGNQADLPSPSLVERYVKGEYGEKTGKGWYEYKK
ncbi:MAG TPA: 3-hydroxyacyl-CoA dehydrogenase family protein [Deltaproteobacteria bacterium]|jgi:3-hydroxybutyryl-CoA dehydrogenase|nr:3-hydroxyacyl-CoA dehydrogenase family protein [Deltaproteobacteria bacterium]HOI08087.1 3-hydroxyacyl-CoA dehydrogenase family protein [Deltaproteobacteria bacterium]